MTRYAVSQGFETLGDPCRTEHGTRESAEVAAATLREQIAEVVAHMAVPDPNDAEWAGSVGWAHEVEAWAYAGTLSDGTTYGREAGEYIAGEAVAVEQIKA
jgi:hypothetical protein